MVGPTGGILLATCDDTGPGGISQPASMCRQSARRRGLDAGGVLHAQGMRQSLANVFSTLGDMHAKMEQARGLQIPR